jgi:cytochrome c oxidase assembly protein subunit 15
VQRLAGIMVLLVMVQIYLGALVAGLHAGLSYNTWPLMDGAVVPGDLLVVEPAWRNFFEKPEDRAVRAPDVRLCGAGRRVLACLRDNRGSAAGDDPCAAGLGAGFAARAAVRRRSASAPCSMQAHMHWALLHQGFAHGGADLRHGALARDCKGAAIRLPGEVAAHKPEREQL